MINNHALNLLGGVPDIVFRQSAKILLKRNPLTYQECLNALSFYSKYSRKASQFFTLPRKSCSMTCQSEKKFLDGTHKTYQFPSLYKVKNPDLKTTFFSFEKNQMTYLHLWQHSSFKNSKKRPLVLCLHGFLLGNVRVAENMFRIKKLFQCEVDVGLFILPHHGERTHFFLNQHFLNPHNVPLTLESFAQAQHDLHLAILNLRAMGYEKIGLLGASLGGLTGIYYITLSSLVDFLFAVVPVLKLHDYLMPKKSYFHFPVTEELKERTRVALDLISPEYQTPKISKEDIGVVVHGGDKLNDIKHTKAWMQAWQLSCVTEVAGGHWWYFDKKIRGRTWYSWLKAKEFIL